MGAMGLCNQIKTPAFKKRISRFQAALLKGEAIRMPDGGWTVADMFVLNQAAHNILGDVILREGFMMQLDMPVAKVSPKKKKKIV
ncbi:MAG TPA: hypothetical protein VHV55_14625 [Pirellulales bacterium]|jgi:hypothetical protein|nr:hypothetical protein [Pirellulales bacterium]